MYSCLFQASRQFTTVQSCPLGYCVPIPVINEEGSHLRMLNPQSRLETGGSVTCWNGVMHADAIPAKTCGILVPRLQISTRSFPRCPFFCGSMPRVGYLTIQLETLKAAAFSPSYDQTCMASIICEHYSEPRQLRSSDSSFSGVATRLQP